jgi:hypothetical protein
LGKLLRPVSGEDEMGMGIDKPGQHCGPTAVELREVSIAPRYLGGRPHPGDPSLPDRDYGIVNDAQQPPAAGIVSNEFTDPGNKEVAGGGS